MADLLIALLLGVVEGITEFLPISSTGHLILLVDLVGFKGPPGRVFEVVIQFGAILGVCIAYRERLMPLIVAPLSSGSFSLLKLLVIGFLPALVIGYLAHDFIKTILFDPLIVAIALVVGGLAIIAIERARFPAPVTAVEGITPVLALKVGLCQALAMIPGTSRSGATIMGGRLLGLDRPTAATFSFLLAIPTMLAASSYDLYRNANMIDAGGGVLLGAGFLAAFASAILTVRWLIAFVSKHSFAPFGWYRIIFGLLMLIVLLGRS